ncbi:MAG: vWA domain-containing protein [Ktedonobacterales bacterium]
MALSPRKLPTKLPPQQPMASVKPEPKELTAKQKSDWEMTRAKLLWSCPAFSHVFYTMMAGGKDIAVITSSVPIAATDGSRLLINPETFFNYNLDERVFVCVHEIMHGIFAHCEHLYNWQRTGTVKYPDGTELPYVHDWMNKAMDYVINDALVESKVGAYNKDWLHDTTIATKDDSVIDAYKKVFEKEGNCGSQTQFDVHMAPGSATGKDPVTAAGNRNEAEWKAQVEAGIAAAKAQGKMPAGLERFLGHILEPQVDWKEKIRALMARRLGTGRRDWRRPDRRLITREIYAPGRAGFSTGKVVVAIDTSGSIGQQELDMFLGEVAGILDDCKPENLYMMWCDAAVHRVDECDEVGDLNSIRAKGAPGGGGTSFIPVFDKIGELGLAPEALVYLTDGYGSFPDMPPAFPVIWGNISPKDAVKYPFGDVVDIPRQAPK